MATWVYSKSAVQTLITDLRGMGTDNDKYQTTHKEETSERIETYAADRMPLRQTLEGCTDPFDSNTHPR